MAGEVNGYHAAHLPEDPARAVVWKVVAASRRVAVDIWPEIARDAQPGVETEVIDASRELMTLGEAGFDAVLASNVLEHFDPAVAMSVPRFLPYSMRASKLPIRSWTVRAYLRSPIKPMAGQMLVVASKI